VENSGFGSEIGSQESGTAPTQVDLPKSNDHPSPTTHHSRKWIWFFVALAILGVAAVSINWVWNAGEPLTPERLRTARELWQKNRPADYDLKIDVTKQYQSADGTGGTIVDKIELHVRGGKITEFLVRGKEPEPLLNRDDSRNEQAERARRESYDMAGLFDSIEEFMDKDRRDGRTSFIRARFDKTDGHVVRFSRQVDGKQQPHIKVELIRVNP
jgi:hypothetical protein